MSDDDDTRTFPELAAELGDGLFAAEATRLLQEVIAKVRRHGGAGNVTIRFDLEAVGDAVEITPSFRCKRPHAPIPSTKVWSTPDGDLTLKDPTQGVLQFRRPKGSA